MNNFEQKEFELEKIKYKYTYDFYNIYDDIKENAIKISNDLLTYDYIGFKNTNAKIVNFVNSCITTNTFEKKHHSDEEYNSDDE